MSETIEGYPQIAQFMSEHKELGILRRFGELNMLTLLHLQAELMHLEEAYSRLSEADEKSSSRAYRSRDWWSLTQLDCNGNREQWDLLLQIRETLDKYNRQLRQQIWLADRLGPNDYDLSFFRDWLKHPRMGNFPLRGIDRKAWDPIYDHDFIAIQRRTSVDPFSRWFINIIIPKFHSLIGHRITTPLPRTEITNYKESILLKILDVLRTVLACLLPVSCIVVLYFVTSMRARLGILIGFTAIFSLCLSLVTGATRIEVFAATSAFAAVQIVFLSGNSGQIP
ncbi:hypothetical protein L207DRAFT_498390 [Hyaloscypha variabilis F]|uniref:DUF6594 domain-containing protein n=1 Tax=Hyaloscypha variabilis (strain UAMH 11265 / GT02V1 / F) TaxID=1149755 RepID=A0A2J6R5S1_HYAVF|nr:hypothetical protein L207DRAFT_498390 [Hyaloscypha variabilis F]